MSTEAAGGGPKERVAHPAPPVAQRFVIPILVSLLVLSPIGVARAEASLLGGIADLVSAVFALPTGILAGTLSGPPILGTVGGALQGAINTLGYTARGTLQLIGVAIPLAMKAAPLIPLIL